MTPALLFLLILQASTGCSSSDHSLPSYLQGLNWNTVKEHQNEDLSLSDNVLPRHYSIALSVNIRGWKGADRSDLNGTVSIAVDFEKPTDFIELHSVDLHIQEVLISESGVGLGIAGISANLERETIAIHLNRTVAATETCSVLIKYEGVARMDEYGLYENWNPRFNLSKPNLPFVLASNNFPTGARRWFPCFDEPEKLATFQLTVTYPEGLSAYSNTDRSDPDTLDEDRVTTTFKATRRMPSYHVALAINDFVTMKSEPQVPDIRTLLNLLDSNKITIWRSGNHDKFTHADYELVELLELGLRSQAKLLGNTSLHEKLDIILLDGTQSITVHPGLMTIGRDERSGDKSGIKSRKGCANVTKLAIGNRMWVRSTDEMWLIDALARFFTQDPTLTKINAGWSFMHGKYIADDFFYTSLHELPLRESKNTKRRLRSTTAQLLEANKHQRSMKASQLLQLVHRMCPEAEKVYLEYIEEYVDNFANIDDFVNKVSTRCEKAKDFLADFLDKPGKPYLLVWRRPDFPVAVIRQTRFHSTYFLEEARDDSTRYTLPVFYTINGKAGMKMFPRDADYIAVAVPFNATFLIDNNYELVYNVFYEDVLQAGEDADRGVLKWHAQKSLMSAMEIGFIRIERVVDQMTEYVESRVFSSTDVMLIISDMFRDYANRFEETSRLNINRNEGCSCCMSSWDQTSWSSLFNSDAAYFENSAGFSMSMRCLSEWHNSAVYRKFLEATFLGEESTIRPDSMKYIRQTGFLDVSWMELHQFFFDHAHNITSPTWTRLANIVLGIEGGIRVWPHNALDLFYPNFNWRADYLERLHTFTRQHPRRAAEFADEIEMRVEREFVREQRPKWNNVDRDMLFDYGNTLYQRASELQENDRKRSTKYYR